MIVVIVIVIVVIVIGSGCNVKGNRRGSTVRVGLELGVFVRAKRVGG